MLRATVHHYVDTIEPVSSKTLVRRFGLQESAATVRSAMGALEQRGFLTQPHISAGRVPSPRGYRHYVDCLLPPPGTAVNHLEKELTRLSLKWAALDDFLWQIAKRLTDFTGLMSLITKPSRTKTTLQEVRLVRSDNRLLVMLVENSSQANLLNLRLPHEMINELEGLEAWTKNQLIKSGDGKLNWKSLPRHLITSGSFLKEAIDNHREAKVNSEEDPLFHGISQLISQPEFNESNSFKPLLELIDRKPKAVIPLNKAQKNGVWIGDEHPEKALAECSVVQATYFGSSESVGQVALIGPTRMAYSTAIAAVSKVAKHLERRLN